MKTLVANLEEELSRWHVSFTNLKILKLLLATRSLIMVHSLCTVTYPGV